MRVTTPGRLLMQEAIPSEYMSGDKPLTNSELVKVFTKIAKTNPDKYSEIMGRLTDTSKDVVYRYGREASLGLEDLRPTPTLSKYRDKLRKDIASIISADGLTGKEKNEKIVALLYSRIAEIPELVTAAAKEKSSGFYAQVASGARGNKNQLMQVIFGDTLIVDAENKPVPIPALHGYGEGVKPLEYWAASSGARKGSIAVQFSTADGGYLGKQLNNIGHRLVVVDKDCGTSQGLPVEADDTDNIGSVLARDTDGIKAGTIITPEIMPKFKSKKILVRSLITCGLGDGVCAMCSGVRERGTLPALGDPVGLVGARAMSEPITQAGLGQKHSGGVAGVDDKKVRGFEELNQFIQVPTSFKGAAVLAEQDGVVLSIKDAPAGGSFVLVNGAQHYVPRGSNVSVKRGDKVVAGDMLSDGTPNPEELVKYKGIGEGRRYFVEKYRELLKANKADLQRRNIEAVARGFINRVQIQKPEGYNGYLIEDIVPYDELAANYEIRENSQELSPREAKNMFLEKPVLHYSIGTRVTPNIIKELTENKVDKVVANKEDPVFSSMVIRARSILATDPDWQTRLAGENLKKVTLEAARMGATSTPEGTSYFPAAANPTGLDLYKGGQPIKTIHNTFVSVK